jgi:hypothetical protein
MEPLVIKFRGQLISRKVIGAFFIIIGIYFLFDDPGVKEMKDWIFPVLMILCGIFYLTPWSGANSLTIIPGEHDLKIRWKDSFRWILLRPAGIEKIILGRFFIIINRKDKKPLKFNLTYLDMERKTQVYTFFIEYARSKNLLLEKHGMQD